MLWSRALDEARAGLLKGREEQLLNDVLPHHQFGYSAWNGEN